MRTSPYLKAKTIDQFQSSTSDLEMKTANMNLSLKNYDLNQIYLGLV